MVNYHHKAVVQAERCVCAAAFLLSGLKGPCQWLM